MIPHSEWEWYGDVGHCCVGRWCRFHLHTRIGAFIVSTIGQYVHPRHSGGSEQEEAKWLKQHPNGEEIGCDRLYETFVFRHSGNRCGGACNCGEMMVEDYSEIDSLGANDQRTANENHMTLCLKYANME